MKLIADSGSTKTDWVLTHEGTVVATCQTQGINPFHQSEDDITAILRQELIPALRQTMDSVQSSIFKVVFYGSGVRPEVVPRMAALLRAVLTHADAEAHSDLLGAARAVCGRREGVACILGTGANSCLYDGRTIVGNTPSLGYILGDEGSGAVLGIRFLNALYKGFMPKSLVADFEGDSGYTLADVIDRVYRRPLANRFLASLSPFIARHLDEPALWQLVVDNFRGFFRRNVAPYGRPDLPIGFVGSMAYHYAAALREAAAAEGFTVGLTMKSPIDGLIAYHQSNTE